MVVHNCHCLLVTQYEHLGFQRASVSAWRAPQLQRSCTAGPSRDTDRASVIHSDYAAAAWDFLRLLQGFCVCKQPFAGFPGLEHLRNHEQVGESKECRGGWERSWYGTKLVGLSFALARFHDIVVKCMAVIACRCQSQYNKCNRRAAALWTLSKVNDQVKYRNRKKVSTSQFLGSLVGAESQNTWPLFANNQHSGCATTLKSKQKQLRKEDEHVMTSLSLLAQFRILKTCQDMSRLVRISLLLLQN